jgi:hypothetical protein
MSLAALGNDTLCVLGSLHEASQKLHVKQKKLRELIELISKKLSDVNHPHAVSALSSADLTLSGFADLASRQQQAMTASQYLVKQVLSLQDELDIDASVLAASSCMLSHLIKESDAYAFKRRNSQAVQRLIEAINMPASEYLDMNLPETSSMWCEEHEAVIRCSIYEIRIMRPTMSLSEIRNTLTFSTHLSHFKPFVKAHHTGFMHSKGIEIDWGVSPLPQHVLNQLEASVPRCSPLGPQPSAIGPADLDAMVTTNKLTYLIVERGTCTLKEYIDALVKGNLRREITDQMDVPFAKWYLDVALGIVNGVAILHRNNIVHTGLRPENIVLFYDDDDDDDDDDDADDRGDRDDRHDRDHVFSVKISGFCEMRRCDDLLCDTGRLFADPETRAKLVRCGVTEPHGVTARDLKRADLQSLGLLIDYMLSGVLTPMSDMAVGVTGLRGVYALRPDEDAFHQGYEGLPTARALENCAAKRICDNGMLMSRFLMDDSRSKEGMRDRYRMYVHNCAQTLKRDEYGRDLDKLVDRLFGSADTMFESAEAVETFIASALRR